MAIHPKAPKPCAKRQLWAFQCQATHDAGDVVNALSALLVVSPAGDGYRGQMPEQDIPGRRSRKSLNFDDGIIKIQA